MDGRGAIACIAMNIHVIVLGGFRVREASFLVGRTGHHLGPWLLIGHPISTPPSFAASDATGISYFQRNAATVRVLGRSFNAAIGGAYGATSPTL